MRPFGSTCDSLLDLSYESSPLLTYN